jgi:hypothetical protein
MVAGYPAVFCGRQGLGQSSGINEDDEGDRGGGGQQCQNVGPANSAQGRCREPLREGTCDLQTLLESQQGHGDAGHNHRNEHARNLPFQPAGNPDERQRDQAEQQCRQIGLAGKHLRQAAISFSQGVLPSTEIPRRVGSWDTATSKAMPLR